MTPFNEAESKKRHKQLVNLCERIKFQFSLKKIKTWRDVYAYTFVPPNTTEEHLNKEVQFVFLKEYLTKLLNELEQEQRVQRTNQIHIVATVVEGNDNKANIKEDAKESVKVVEPTREEIEKEIVKNDGTYGLVSSRHEKCFMYWFQRKAVKELLDGILGFDTSVAKDTDELRDYYNKHKE